MIQLSTLSAVVQLIDAYRGQPAVAAAARFRLDGRAVQPQAKPDAFYAFVDLAPGSHQLEIDCAGYLNHQIELDVPIDLKPPRTLSEAIKTCQLQPGPGYAFPAQVTLLRGQVLDAHSGQPLQDVSVSAIYADLRHRTRTRQTLTSGEGRHGGRYALALPGRLAARATATLIFSRAGHASTTQLLDLRTGATCILDDVRLVPQATNKK